MKDITSDLKGLIGIVQQLSVHGYLVGVSIFLASFFAPLPAHGQNEIIISKDEMDFVFSLTQEQWDQYATEFVAPEGWTIRSKPLATGTVVMAFNRQMQIGLSTQPLFYTTSTYPKFVLVGNWYEEGLLPETPATYDGSEFQHGIDQGIAYDLGDSYEFSTSMTQQEPIVMIQIMVWLKK